MKEHEAKIKYSSKGTTPDGNPFISVKMARGYYEYVERGGQDSIGFVLFDNTSQKFLVINEQKPPMDERLNKRAQLKTAFGGSVDCDDPLEVICHQEVQEEAGYNVNMSRIHKVGSTMVSSQMSQMCHLYLVDVTGIPKTLEAEWEKAKAKEGYKEHEGNSVHWMTYSELMENQDWKSIFIATQSVYLDII